MLLSPPFRHRLAVRGVRAAVLPAIALEGQSITMKEASLPFTGRGTPSQESPS
ncbi:MAG: hypothetical protein HKN71_08105 [Gemmatimonadetes bacterium]|nr:hypothetical protein [Gemmatimonadota bacterium]